MKQVIVRKISFCKWRIYCVRICTLIEAWILRSTLHSNAMTDEPAFSFCLWHTWKLWNVHQKRIIIFLPATLLWFVRHASPWKSRLQSSQRAVFPCLKSQFLVSRVLQATQFGIHLCSCLSVTLVAKFAPIMRRKESRRLCDGREISIGRNKQVDPRNRRFKNLAVGS